MCGGQARTAADGWRVARVERREDERLAAAKPKETRVQAYLQQEGAVVPCVRLPIVAPVTLTALTQLAAPTLVEPASRAGA